MSAGIVESNSQKDTEIVKAGNEQQFRQKQIEKEKAISIAEQKKVEEVAQAEQVANTKKVDAKRTYDVGIAEIEKQKVIKVAEGDAGARTTRATAEAEYTQVTGQAEANIIKAKALAEAEGTEKKALALKQYNEAGLSLEMIKAQVDIKRAQFGALSEGLKVAKIHLVTSGESNILGIPVGAEIGADLGAMLVALQNQGIDITQLLQQLPISETAKLAIAAKAGVEVVKEGTKGKEEPKRR
jgi:flotillin